MRRINLPVLIIILLALTKYSTAQQRPLGTWRMYLPYNVSLGVCDAGDKVYSASSQSLFSYDKNSGEVRTYDKSSGLSDVGIQGIYYDPSTSCLAVTYTNSNIDLIFNETSVYNISDIKTKAQTTPIAINNISFYQGNAYASTDIGIAVISLTDKDILNTYVIGSTGSPIKVYQASFDSVNIYAATDEGVKYAPFTAANLSDFHSWNLFGTLNTISAKATAVVAYNNKVYIVVSNTAADTLYEYTTPTGWKKIFYATSSAVKSINVINGAVYLSVWSDSAGNSGFLGKITTSDSLVFQQKGQRPVSWFESNGTRWVADFWHGLYRGDDAYAIIPDGPYSASVFRMQVSNNILYMAAGGVDDTWGYTFNRDGFSIYKNNQWSFRNGNTDPALSNYSDIICVAAAPTLDKTYFGSYYAGLIRYENSTGSLTLYDTSNSLLEVDQGDVLRTKISCLTTDYYSNVWLGNAGALHSLKVIKPDNTWKQFNLPYHIADIKNILVDDYDQLWMPVRGNQSGIVVWSYNETLDDSTDDKSKVISTGQGAGGLPSNNVFCMTEDQDGNLWAGTDQGIAVFYCPGSVFDDGGCDAELIKTVAADGFVAYLFSTENVRAIAVDAANRKWVGTDNGAFLVSADGQTQLLSFNVTNSPMPANQVTDIQIDPTSGEVFIGTVGGLVGYEGDAVGTTDCADCNKALVYPNPVNPGYTGPIAIKNLVQNAYVKITDVNGILVYQGRANGTQMVWDGITYTGARVKSGVYLVFSSTDLGKTKRVAKFLIAN